MYYACNEIIKESIAGYPATINSQGELTMNEGATRADMKGVIATSYNAAHVAVMEHNKLNGTAWLEASTEKYGCRKLILIELFGEDEYERMLAYFSVRATVCKKWLGRWRKDKNWQWHRYHHPDEEEGAIIMPLKAKDPEDYSNVKVYRNGNVNDKCLTLKLHHHFGLEIPVWDEKLGRYEKYQLYFKQLEGPVIHKVAREKFEALNDLEAKGKPDIVIKRSMPK
jgi:hypothetical protein